MARLRRGTEEEVVWREGDRDVRNVRLPVGGKSIYVTRKEAAYLATVAVERKIRRGYVVIGVV